MANKIQTIKYRRTEQDEFTDLPVVVVPDTRGKAVMDENRDFYYYHFKTEQWIKVRHGIYHLYRALSYMLLGYIYMEMPALEKIIKQCEQAHLGQMFINKCLPTNNHLNMYTLLCSMAERMSKAIDENKQRACLQLAYCTVNRLRDSKGRLNNGVLQCRTATAKRRLEDRLGTIAQIQPKILYIHQRIRSILTNLEQLLVESRQRLKNSYEQACLADKWDKQNARYHSIKQSIEITKDNISRLNIKPFTKTRARLLKESDQALAAMETDTTDQFGQIVSKMVNSLRLMICRGQMEYSMINLGLAIKKPVLMDEDLLLVVQDQLRQALDVITSVNEQGFEQPVCTDAADALIQAVDELDFISCYPPDRRRIKKAKALLDKAIGML